MSLRSTHVDTASRAARRVTIGSSIMLATQVRSCARSSRRRLRSSATRSGGCRPRWRQRSNRTLVRGAVLVDPSLFVPERGLSASRRGFEGVRAQAGRPVEELAESLPLAAAESRSLLDPDVMEPWLDGSVGAGVATEDVLSQVQCPVLLVHGDPAKGGVLEPEEVRRISELLRDVQIEAVDAGHAIPSAEPELLATLIEGFVSRIDSSTE